MFGAILPVQCMGAVVIAAGAQCLPQHVVLVIIADIEGITPGLQSIEAAVVVVILVLLLELVDKVVVTSQVFADQLPVIDLVTDDTKCVVTQGQS